MYAKFSGQCQACRATFPAGEPITWSKQTGARHHTCPASRPENQTAPCWDCKAPGKFRGWGASTPVYCDACDARHLAARESRQLAAEVDALTEDEAWELTEEEGKAPPYRGGALRLRNGRLLSALPSGKYTLGPASPQWQALHAELVAAGIEEAAYQRERKQWDREQDEAEIDRRDCQSEPGAAL